MILGREEPLALIAGCLDGGPDRAVLLCGEAGMGKSAVLHEAGRRAAERGARVVSAGLGEGSARVRLGLVDDLLAQLEPTSEPGVARTVPQMAARLAEQLRRAARTRPVLVLVDDIDRADEPSLAALTLAVARLLGEPVASVAASRSRRRVDPRLARWRRVELPPLPEDAAVALLEGTLGAPLRLEQARRVVSALDRCPLAIVECRRLLTPDEIMGRRPLPPFVPLDERLRASWGADTDSLTPAARDALATLCVLAPPRLDLLGEALRRRGTTASALGEAVAAGLVRWPEATTPSPVSPWACAAVLERLTRAERQALHREVAAAARRLDLPPAVVLDHLAAAAQPGDEAVAQALATQARRAHERDQPEVASRGWEVAARTTTDPDERRRWAVEAARAWLTESASSEGRGPLLDLLHEAELDPDDRVWRDWLEADVLAGTDLAGSAAALERAAGRAERASPDLVPWLLWGAAATWWLVGDASSGLRVARRLAAQPAACLRPAWLATAVLGTAYLQAGCIEQALPLLSEATELSASWSATAATPVADLVNVVGIDELLLAGGRDREGRVEALVARLTDDPGHTLAAAQLMLAWRALRRDAWELARTHLEESLRLARAVQARTQEASALCLAVEMDALTGRETALEQTAADLTALAQPIGDRRSLAHVHHARGLADLAAGRAEQAIVHLEPLTHTPVFGRGLGDPPLRGRVDLVEAYERAGEHDAASALLDALTDPLVRLPDASAAAALARCRALLALADEDRDRSFATALHSYGTAADVTGSFEEARTRLLLGEHLRRTRRRAEARAQLRSAAATFDRLGARPWLARARGELRVAGAGPVRHAGLGGLTPQERRVAEVVATGASNREAAQTLVLSVRTVEFHLASIYRKLGITGRTALAHLIAEESGQD